MLISINQKSCSQLTTFAYWEVGSRIGQPDIIGGGNYYAESCFELCFFFFVNRYPMGPIVLPHKNLQ